MTKTIKIEGMMCNNCVNHVVQALIKTEGVTKADVTLEDKQAVVQGTATDEALKKAVEDVGYQVVSIS